MSNNFTEYVKPVSNDLLARIEHRISAGVQKVNQADDCSPAGTKQNDIYFVTISSGPAGNAKGDIPIHLPKPYGRIMLVSISATGGVGSRQYMHLTPLGKRYTGTSIAADGTEAWLSFRGQGGVGDALSNMLKFRQGLQDFYIDLDFAAGGVSYFFTLACFDEDFDVQPNYAFVQ